MLWPPPSKTDRRRRCICCKRLHKSSQGENTSLSGRHGLLSELGYNSGSKTGRGNQGRGSQSWWAQNHLKGLLDHRWRGCSLRLSDPLWPRDCISSECSLMLTLLARAEQCERQRSRESSKRFGCEALGSLNPNKQKSMERFQFYFLIGHRKH